MKSIHGLLDNPVFMRGFHGWMTVHWLIHIPVVVLLYLLAPGAWEAMSILYLAIASIYANVVGHLGSWQGVRVEVKQEADADVQEVLDEVKKVEEEVAA